MKVLQVLIIGLASSLLPTDTLMANTIDSDDFTIYLVRHAEKQKDSDNPSLTECGVQRANQLTTILEQANITNIYSTQYKRTEQTARPLADALSITVQPYSPRDLKTFTQQIKQLKQNALIVGHSNTTPQLTALLASKPVENITEKEYQMLYQVNFRQSEPKLTILKQPLTCH